MDEDTSTPAAAAVPPIIDPEDFHSFEGLRETTLSLFTDPEHNAALRATGRLIYTMASEGEAFLQTVAVL